MHKRLDDDPHDDEVSFSFSGVIGLETLSLCSSRQNGFVRGDADSFDFHSGKTPKIKNHGPANKRTTSITPPLIERPSNGSWRVTPLGFVVTVVTLILIVRITASAIATPLPSSPYDFGTEEIKNLTISSLEPIHVEAAAESMEEKPLRVATSKRNSFVSPKTNDGTLTSKRRQDASYSDGSSSKNNYKLRSRLITTNSGF
jgi:hypothetical protein